MESHIVKVLETQRLTPHVKRFVTQKPAGFTFIPGQGTEIAINKPGLQDVRRPFSFTGCNTDDYLEFIIKMYTGHDGVTEKLQAVEAGDELIIHGAFGSIRYKGPGVFIACGTGITPFIAILRQLKLNNALRRHYLLLANHFARDIILKDELEEMLDDRCYHILAHRVQGDMDEGRADSMLLGAFLDDASYYYICGSDGFVAQAVATLVDIGVAEERIVTEKQPSPQMPILVDDASHHGGYLEPSININTKLLTISNV